MIDYIDTREGWRELDVVTPDSIYQLAEYDPKDGSVVRAWVREAPVPPLPTAPYTVIRVTWDAGGTEVAYLNEGGDWIGRTWQYGPSALAGEAASFEVLSEPRAVTAAEIMEDFETHHWDTSAATVNAIFRNYGVES